MNRHNKAVIAATTSICLGILALGSFITAGICFQNPIMQPFGIGAIIAGAICFVSAFEFAERAKDNYGRANRWDDTLRRERERQQIRDNYKPNQEQ